MLTFIAVLRELGYFVFVEFFGAYPQRPIELVVEESKHKRAVIPATPPLVVEPLASADTVEDRLVGERVFTATPNIPLYIHPTISLDGVLSRLPYATPLMYRRRQGRWAEVMYEDTTGWVEETSLVLNEGAVRPLFFSNNVYESTHDETIKLRTLIEDEFNTIALELPLQGIEYVQYRLLECNRKISWPTVRPRIAGSWQNILRGQVGIHMSIQPKTYAVMEWCNEDGTGQVGMVEAVTPDQTIRVSLVRDDQPGLYEEITYSEAQWREWRPVFIEVT